MYETKISDAKWITYDIPGNVGWIAYLVTMILCLKKGVDALSIAAIIPAVLMLVGVAELISERIAKLDRILPKVRLYRGFGALTLGGVLGALIAVIGFAIKKQTLFLIMLAGAVLCAVFAGLLFKGYQRR
ncbi:MAG: hypothetical protein IJX67_06730 [Oscillospiraceae bacterium]|nr:hypothetical protein [Oscillospiraceae bacterium]